MTHPAISVLICTRNREADLARCVPSILSGTFTDIELVIVDQGNSSAEHCLASYRDPRIRHIPTPTRGLSRARNIALTEARSDLVLFTDDDCICDSRWVEAMIDEFRNHPEIMGVFGRVLPFGDRSSEKMVCPCTIEDMDSRIVATPVLPHQYLGHGNNMAFRKSMFQAIGMYNPFLGAGTRWKSGEDTDMSYRALRHHMPLKYTPAPLVYHNNWREKTQMVSLISGYTLGFSAVFGRFALRGDLPAREFLRARWKKSRENREPWTEFQSFLFGQLAAVFLFLWGDPAWPREKRNTTCPSAK